MMGEKMVLAKLAIKGAARTLKKEDYFGVLAFDMVPKWVFPPRQNTSETELDLALQDMAGAGGTDVHRALRVAYAGLKKLDTNVKHVILATDGQTPLADFAGLVHQMSEDGITISTVAIGFEADINLLARISSWGGGGFYCTQSIAEIPQIFTADVKRFLPLEDDKPEEEEKKEEKPKEEEEKKEPEKPPERIVAKPEEPTEKPEKEAPPKKYRLVKIEDLQVIAGMPKEKLPTLDGRTFAEDKPLSAVALATDDRVPVLALGRAGLGRVVYWGSDVTSGWAADLVQWPFYSKLFSQAVNAASALGGIRETAIATRVRKDKDDLEITAVIYPAPGAEKQDFTLTAQSVGAGEPLRVEKIERRVFRLRAPAPPPDRPDVIRLTARSGQGNAATRLVIVDDLADDQRDTGADSAREALAGQHDVIFQELARAQIAPSLEIIKRRRDLSVFAALAALVCFVAAVAEARRTGVIG